LKVFKNAWFGRFARKENISAQVLWDAVDRVEKGLVDADLGGGVIKFCLWLSQERSWQHPRRRTRAVQEGGQYDTELVRRTDSSVD
jgi:hypothetical protein